MSKTQAIMSSYGRDHRVSAVAVIVCRITNVTFKRGDQYVCSYKHVRQLLAEEFINLR